MGMFQGCTALTEAPTLWATTLAANCYNYMFAQSGLTTAPALPAETLAADCYEGMFYGCTNLTTAPELPAKTLVESCYDGMFYGCSNLNYIKMLATKITAKACLDNWVDGVAGTGTFVKAPRTAISEGISGIPSGWTTENTPLYLANNASNSTDINSANGQTCDVVLSDRTLYKDEDWNTLCLPFALASLTGTPLEGADVRTLESSSLSNSTLSMSFSESSLTAIEAGKPYLVKWASGDNIVNPVFSNVTINSTTANVETTNVNFVGSYDPVVFNSADNTVLYLSTGSTLYYPSEAMTFGTCRAHFKLQGDLTVYSANGIKAFKLDFNGTETGIRSAEENENTTIYDLSGRKVQKMQKGLYIVNGKKILK